MKINASRWGWDLFFYFFIVLSTVLYIYSINFAGVNISLFRALMIFWICYFFGGVLLFRKKMRGTFSVLFLLLGLIFLVNAFDWIRPGTTPEIHKDMVNHALNLCLAFLVAVYVNTERRVDAVIYFYALGSILALYIAVFSVITGELPFEGIIRSYQSVSRETVNFVSQEVAGFRLTSAFHDPNFYGIYLCFAIFSCLYLYNYVKKTKLLLFLTLVNLFALMLTMSRTAMLACLALLLISVFRVERFIAKVSWVLPVIALIVLWGLSNYEMIASVINLGRFGDSSSVVMRFTYYAIGLQTFLDHPVFGGGTVALLHGSAHLTYLSLLAKYGVVGAGVYLAFLLYPLLYALKNRKRLSKKYLFLICGMYSIVLVAYCGYDVFQFLEFQYLYYGLIYSVVMNRLGLSDPAMPCPHEAMS